MKTAGVESKKQLPIPVNRLVAPGPLVAMATPGTPVMRPTASAANAAACSWCMLTSRVRPCAYSESRRWVIIPPTSSNT